MKMKKVGWYCGSAVVVLALQMMAVRFVSIGGVTPDILLIWLLYLTLMEGQIPGTIGGFLVGLSFDLGVGGFVGLTALSKTVACFLGGYFHNENKTLITLGSYRFIMMVFAISLVHNALYFVIFVAGTQMSYFSTVFWYGLATAVYTAVVALLPMFWFSRKVRFE